MTEHGGLEVPCNPQMVWCLRVYASGSPCYNRDHRFSDNPDCSVTLTRPEHQPFLRARADGTSRRGAGNHDATGA
eukprot:scaffold63309_cov63-Phaeocystis_antarctica.AAC.2